MSGSTVGLTYWRPETETLPREKLQGLQLSRLQSQLAYVYQNSGLYRRKLDEAGLRPADIRSLEDARRLPFTTKEDLRESQARQPPWGDFLCIRPEEGVRVFQTTGTTGTPVRVLLSKNDWYVHYYEQFMHFMHAYGITSADVLFVPFNYGLYIAWWGFQAALEQAGVTIVPGGGQSSEIRVRNIFDWNATVVCGTPTYLLYLAETAERMGFALPDSAVHTVVAAGEPGAAVPSTKRLIEERWGARCYDDIGSTEITNFGFECRAQQGTHVIESMFWAECLDPDTLEPADAGEVGELVLSNLCTESMPLLRYRTGDLVRPAYDTCTCARTFLRLEGGVLGRCDDMFQFAGVNIFPSAIENLIREIPDLSTEYQLVVPRKGSGAHLRIRVEPAHGDVPAERLAQAAQRLVETTKYRVTVTPDIELVGVGALPRFELKAKRVIWE
jgi:phenylacetate-CoA ligase